MITQTDSTKGIRDTFRRLLDGTHQVVQQTASDLVSSNTALAHYERQLAGQQPEAPPAPQANANAEVVAAQRRADEIVTKYRAEFDKRVKEKAAQVASGEISPGVFRAAMLGEIRAALYTAAAAAAGNAARLRPQDFARIDAEVRRQAQYLDNWIAQIERTPPEQRSAAQLQMRATMYGGAMGRFASETTDQVVFKEFPNLPFHPRDWTTLCGGACACGWVWQDVDKDRGSAAIYWRLNVERTVIEHCETCLLRAKAFNPLRIENWQFVNMPTDLSALMVD